MAKAVFEIGVELPFRTFVELPFLMTASFMDAALSGGDRWADQWGEQRTTARERQPLRQRRTPRMKVVHSRERRAA